MDIVSNNLTGDDITETIAVLTKMQVFNLFSNNVGGPLPAVLGKFVNLKVLDLEFNKFTGPVVIEEYVALDQLEEYLVGSNDLTGTLPGAIENWTMLKSLSLGLNKLDGPIPPEIGSLSELGKNGKRRWMVFSIFG